MHPIRIIFLFSLLAIAYGQREDRLSIDTFTPNAALFFASVNTDIFPETYSRSQTSAGALGGERDIFFIISEAEFGSTLFAQVSSSQLLIALPLSVIGSTVVRYDGINSAGPINEAGLGELNLLDNGADAFTFNINNDHAISALITVYSSEGSSEGAIDIPENLSGTDYNIFFSDFVGTANFAAIGAIEFSLVSTSGEAVDIALANLRTSATVISPTPTSTSSMSPTVTPTSSSSDSPTATMSLTPTPTSSFSTSETPTVTPSADITSETVTPTPTITPSGFETVTPTPTPTQSSPVLDSSETSTPTATITLNPSGSDTTTITVSPTPTRSLNASGSTTPTQTITAIPTGTTTNTGSSTPTRTVNSSNSATSTPSSTPTRTSIASGSNTPTQTRTTNESGFSTPTQTITAIPTGTTTNSGSSTPTRTLNLSGTSTPTISQRSAMSNTPSTTPSRIMSQTRTPTLGTSPSPVAAVSVVVTADVAEVVVEQPALGVLIVAEPLVFGINSTVTVAGVTRILPDAIAVVSSAIDINLFDENGNLIQPNGNVVICFPPVVGGDPARYCLAHLDELLNEWICDNNDVEVTDGDFCSIVPHFTIFALIDRVILEGISDSTFSISITSLPTESDYSSFTYSNPSPISESFSPFTPETLSLNTFSSFETEFSSSSDATSSTLGASFTMFIFLIQLLL